MMRRESALVVFSHLRWNFVYQRPQHLLSRMSAKRPIFFIEEPVFHDSGSPCWDIREATTNLTICTPKTNVHANGYHRDQMPVLQELTAELAAKNGLCNSPVWLYTPMALPLAESIAPSALIFDCMDELSAFLGAPQELLDLERRLLESADLVFTGGPSLYEAKRKKNPHVHCFPSSVDAKHFGAAAKGLIEEPPEQAGVPHPRFGFYGVIDERLDAKLLDDVARMRPNWQFVLVGPVVKVDPKSLPQHPNVHYFGQQEYSRLPSFLKGWDVCLLPFARNESTRFISPTKTLEYMAAEKPIVGTSIKDVVDLYRDIVYLADQPVDFVAACERALTAPAAERAQRTQRMRQVLSKTSWDATAAEMELLIKETIHRCNSAKMRSAVAAAGSAAERRPALPVMGRRSDRHPVRLGSS